MTATSPPRSFGTRLASKATTWPTTVSRKSGQLTASNALPSSAIGCNTRPPTYPDHGSYARSATTVWPCGGVRRALLRLRLPDRFHRDAQSVARRYDQARFCQLQRADWQVGMGRASKESAG